MQKLHFPQPDLRLRSAGETHEVWDVVRKIWVVLTPEEWVRQHLIHYMNIDRGWSLSLMAVEKTLRYNGLVRRADLVIFDSAMQPVLLAECKAPDVALNQQVFDQAALYNRALGVQFVLITNGLHTSCCRLHTGSPEVVWLNEVPASDVRK
ncbi:MAG: type I restriction enzyme HsdR N-terminal domain-containing protein [Flavobacteriales bacterium]